VTTKLEVTITGIECDLEALYGDNDPSTVVIPPYCSNAPPTEPEEEPAPSVPENPQPTFLSLSGYIPQPADATRLLSVTPIPRIQMVDSTRGVAGSLIILIVTMILLLWVILVLLALLVYKIHQRLIKK